MIDSTKLIELANADYDMLKEKGKEGEKVLHYNGFLDGFALGLHEGSNPWHEVSEELPKEEGTYLLRFWAGCSFQIFIGSYRNGKFGALTMEDGDYVTHWMEIPKIKED